MPRHIIKPERDVDFYVEYSTIVDCPVGWGSREDFLKKREVQPSQQRERLERADETGTSSHLGIHAWKDEEIWLCNVADDDRVIKRSDLRAFCLSYGKVPNKFDVSLTVPFDEDIHG